jgi:hypothetical protein
MKKWLQSEWIRNSEDSGSLCILAAEFCPIVRAMRKTEESYEKKKTPSI